MAKHLDVRIRREQGIGIVATEGDDYINIAGGKLIAAACHQLLASDVHHLLVNLRKCNLINCRSLSFLFEVVERAKAQERQVAFCSARPALRKVFQIVEPLQAAPLYHTEREALCALSKSA